MFDLQSNNNKNFDISLKPLVSICIPVYNAERTIGKMIDSIINQTYKNLEIIIVNNASSDNSLKIINEYCDLRIKVYTNSNNIGAENNWNKCLSLATGEFIAILHADDIYHSFFIDESLNAFSEYPDIGAVFSIADIIDEEERKIHEYILHSKLKNLNLIRLTDIFEIIAIKEFFLMTPSAVVRKEVYFKNFPFNYEKFFSAADVDMWFRISEKYPIHIIDKKIMNYRISTTQGSFVYNNKRTEVADFFKVMDYYLYIKKIPISKKGQIIYETHKRKDKIQCIRNEIFNNNFQAAEGKIKDLFSFKEVFLSIKYIRSPYLFLVRMKDFYTIVMLYLKMNNDIRKAND